MSFDAYNFDDTWGRKALRRFYSMIMEVCMFGRGVGEGGGGGRGVWEGWEGCVGGV